MREHAVLHICMVITKEGVRFMFAWLPCRTVFRTAYACTYLMIDLLLSECLFVLTYMWVVQHLTLAWTVLNIGLRRSNIVSDFPEKADIVLCYHLCPVSLSRSLIPTKLEILTFLSVWDLWDTTLHSFSLKCYDSNMAARGYDMFCFFPLASKIVKSAGRSHWLVSGF